MNAGREAHNGYEKKENDYGTTTRQPDPSGTEQRVRAARAADEAPGVPIRMPSDGRTRHRIAFLDGLRGIAILSVIVYHLYGPLFGAYEPFGDRYSNFLLARLGWMGVELFFVISGFVILMTLEQCDRLFEFARRRWLRLFPAMLVASVIMITYDRLVDSGPSAHRSFLDLIPGLTFLSPWLIHALTRVQLQSLDDPFWSLYVEVSFYAIFGVAFFFRGWKYAVGIISALFAISVAASHIDSPAGSFMWRLNQAMLWFGFVFYGWFASGALFFKWHQLRDERLFWNAAAIGVASALTMHVAPVPSSGMTLPVATGLVAVVALFAVSLRSAWLQTVLAWRGLVFLGFVSYPLYLLHQNITIGTAYLLGGQGRAWAVLVPLVPLSAVIVVAWLIATYAEPNMRKLFSGQTT